MKKLLLNLLIVLVVSGILIAVMFTNQSADETVRILKSLDYVYISIAFACVVINWVFGALIIKAIKKGMIGKQRDPGGNFTAFMASEFAAAVTPLASGSQPALVYTLSKKGLDTGVATSIAVIRSFIYLVTELALAIIGFLFMRKYLVQHIPHFYARFIPTIVICLLIVILFLAFLEKGKLANKIVGLFLLLVKRFFPKRYDKIEKAAAESLISFKEGVSVFKTKPWFWFFAFLFQTTEFLFLYLVPVFMLRAIEGTFDNALPLMVCTCICMIVMAYVPTPGTIGGAEAFARLLITPFFVSSPALPVIFIWRVLTYYAKIPFGGICFMVALRGKGAKGKKIKARRTV